MEKSKQLSAVLPFQEVLRMADFEYLGFSMLITSYGVVAGKASDLENQQCSTSFRMEGPISNHYQ